VPSAHRHSAGVDLHDPAAGQVTDDHAVGDRLKDRPVLLRHLRWAFLVRRALLRRNPQVPSRRAFMQASAPRLRHLSHPPAANDRREDRRERRCASPIPAPIMKRPDEAAAKCRLRLLKGFTMPEIATAIPARFFLAPVPALVRHGIFMRSPADALASHMACLSI
jgi:hypothetical protein